MALHHWGQPSSIVLVRDTYKTPRPIIMIMDIFRASFIFKFHIMVIGNNARVKSVSELHAEEIVSVRGRKWEREKASDILGKIRSILVL